ncbi:MAG: TrkH family potassium uptake protein [Deinococcales bacterium]
MRARFAPYVVGTGLLTLAGVMLLFAGYAALAREPVTGFLVTAALAAAFGWTLRRLGAPNAEPTRREALIAVLVSWLAVPALGALPYAITAGFGPIDALFESMSGFTTTGATVLTDFASFPSSLFLWRALSQWVGGIGILVIFIAVFPQLAIAGRQLFFAEAPGPTEERLTPRLRHTATAVVTVYTSLTVLCAASYALAGMPMFDAVAHAFTTLAAGGFSPNARSFQGYASPALDWVATVFMLFAGANFALLYRGAVGRPREILRDPEFRAYVSIAVIASAVLAALLLGSYGLGDALRHGFFQVFSIMTTTGYASADFAQWPQRAQAVLVVVMFIGGSAGSAGGGIKVVRWLIIARNTAREVRRALHPRAVLPVRLGRRVVPEDVLRSVAAFITLYVGLFAASTVTLVLLGQDFVTAFTASIACLGNIGPGLAHVGPMVDFGDLHPLSRLLLTFDMYAGRLEVVTVFVVFTAGWWRLPRRRPASPS